MRRTIVDAMRCIRIYIHKYVHTYIHTYIHTDTRTEEQGTENEGTIVELMKVPLPFLIRFDSIPYIQKYIDT
jgi:hypothetical protein